MLVGGGQGAYAFLKRMTNMHEMALMGEILQVIEKSSKEKGIGKIEKVELIVGEISNVMPDALTMAFDIFKEQNPHFISNEAQLVMHIEEAQAECVLCSSHYKPDHRVAVCPDCQFPSGKIIAGERFEILSYEGREE